MRNMYELYTMIVTTIHSYWNVLLLLSIATVHSDQAAIYYRISYSKYSQWKTYKAMLMQAQLYIPMVASIIT